MKKTFLIGLAVVAVAGVGAAVAFDGPAQNRPAATAAAQQQTTFAIEHMTCATCPISVRKAMMRVEGVKTVDIDFDSKIASVTFDPAVTTADAIAAASTNVGYPATRLDA